ncbi:hypothetical protein, partial [Sulfurimonas sp.]|uniref:hypothetical protein n=1 Tax=Sulfurimonas sp. TaxID=2022749 RepID=UPI0025DC8AE7
FFIIHYRNTLVSYQYTEVCKGFQTPIFLIKSKNSKLTSFKQMNFLNEIYLVFFSSADVATDA